MANANYENIFDDELNINIKKYLFILWDRKKFIALILGISLAFFILLYFILPKTYKVEASLYIKQSNSTNLGAENPYAIDVDSTIAATGILNKVILNELEFMKSAFVMDRVIKDNNLVYVKGKKAGEYITTKAFMKKNIKIADNKPTDIINITYKNNDPEVAYNVVNSIINNYITARKEVYSVKSDYDIKILEKEYNEAKINLEKKIKEAKGLPINSLSGTGTLTAISFHSRVINNALSGIKSQLAQGEQSQIEIERESAKVKALSEKLQWANLVDMISESTNVLVLQEPKLLRDFEYSSPKLIICILVGLLVGIVVSLFAVIFLENVNKKLTYTMMGDEIIYNAVNDFDDIKTLILSKKNDNINFLLFENLPQDILQKIEEYKNISFLKPELSLEFINNIENLQDFISVVKINETDSALYKHINKIITNQNKKILTEVIVG